MVKLALQVSQAMDPFMVFLSLAFYSENTAVHFTFAAFGVAALRAVEDNGKLRCSLLYHLLERFLSLTHLE